MLDITNKKQFDPHLNTQFAIKAQGVGSIKAELIEIESWDKDVIEGFSLIFKEPKESVLLQSTLQLEHPPLGKFELFLGPVSNLE
ncbi:hypothetical protein KAR48_05385 [bacterium]|nr:hypothetical protein [bacterium]